MRGHIFGRGYLRNDSVFPLVVRRALRNIRTETQETESIDTINPGSKLLISCISPNYAFYVYRGVYRDDTFMFWFRPPSP